MNAQTELHAARMTLRKLLRMRNTHPACRPMIRTQIRYVRALMYNRMGYPARNGNG